MAVDTDDVQLTQIVSKLQAMGRAVVTRSIDYETMESVINEVVALGYSPEMHLSWPRQIHKSWLPETQDNNALFRCVGEMMVGWTIMESAGTDEKRRSHGLHWTAPFLVPRIQMRLWIGSPAPVYVPLKRFCPLSQWQPRKIAVSLLRRHAFIGIHDDIFDALLLWRSNSYVPFGLGRDDLSIHGIEEWRAVERKFRDLQAKHLRYQRMDRAMAKWNREDRKKSHGEREQKGRDRADFRAFEVERLANLSFVERLKDIAFSDYPIRFYPHDWGDKAVSADIAHDLDSDTRDALLIKIKGRRRIGGWARLREHLRMSRNAR